MMGYRIPVTAKSFRFVSFWAGWTMRDFIRHHPMLPFSHPFTVYMRQRYSDQIRDALIKYYREGRL